MWYVIQTKTGDEEDIRQLFENMMDDGICSRSFVPLYEEVHRSGGKCRIYFRRFFPGYLFVETEQPEKVFRVLKQIPEFTRLLGNRETSGIFTFVPIGSEDEAFLNTLLDEGTVHVSLIRMAKSGRIEQIVGPLAGYRNHIAKLDIPHRRAIVETEMFGKRRRIRFGLWTENDPPLPWLTRRMECKPQAALDEGSVMDIGLHPGDLVIDASGLYGDQIFLVTDVDPGRRIVRAKTEMFDTTVRIELRADDVSVI